MFISASCPVRRPLRRRRRHAAVAFQFASQITLRTVCKRSYFVTAACCYTLGRGVLSSKLDGIIHDLDVYGCGVI
ncbi:hypothetical protein P692DRAFT_20725812 [Suillus brevipes Sb2]|nr:hypothetical protein P692DRAFT_20725812 [Suillus brevipes Sb2]